MINLSSDLFIIINILVALIYVTNIFNAYKNGFIYGFVSLICLVLSIWAAWFLSPIFASKMSILGFGGDKTAILKMLGLDIFIDTVIWFVILFVLINFIVFLLKPIFKSLTKIPLLGPINKLLGIVIGLINATIITLMLSLIITSPLFSNGKEIKNNTCLIYISSITDNLSKQIYDRAMDEIIGKHEFNADEQRDKLSKWLVEQGIFDE